MYKEEAMRLAEERIASIKNSTDKYVAYKDSRPISDLKQMLASSADLYGDHVAFMQRFEKSEPFAKITYKEAFHKVNCLGSALIDMGLKDKRIAVIGENCSQWAISYLAVTGGVGVVVPLDKELSEDELCQLSQEAEVSAVIFSKKYKDTFLSIKEKLPRIEYLINMNADASAEGILSYDDVLIKGAQLMEGGDRRYLDAVVDPEAMSILLFTSGTTGIAKGVMLSQRSICEDLMSATSILKIKPTDIFFSVLPIHHTYECTCGFLVPLYKGAAIAYCEGLKYIQKNLKEIEPTVFLAVPLIFEALYKGIWKNIDKQGKTKTVKNIMKLCASMGKPGISLQKKLLQDIYAVFGSRMRLLIAGGAAIDPDILDFFNDLGFVALQGYGLTECAPMAALNPDTHKTMRLESVGHLLPGMEVMIDNSDESGIGEICLKGPNVMLGYYNMPEKTAEVIQDGWFRTGDLGYIDDENFIYITGREKNVIITPNGKNVFPEELENYLGKIPYVSESMVWADKDDQGRDTVIVASIYPDKAEVAKAAGEYSRENAKKLLEAAVNEINDNLPLFKQIRRIVVREEEFVKTTGKKIKRFVDSNKEE